MDLPWDHEPLEVVKGEEEGWLWAGGAGWKVVEGSKVD